MENKKLKGGKMKMNEKIATSLAFGIIAIILFGVFAGAAANTASYKTEDVSKKQPTVIYTSSEQPTNTGSGTIAYSSAYGLVELSPEKQFSDTGEATYKVVVRDQHSLSPTTSTTLRTYAFRYKLSFSSAQGLSGKFENDEITLGVGETKVVFLKVFTNSETTATQEAYKIFSVFVTGEDAKEKANGILVMNKGNKQPAPSGTSNKPLEPSGNSFFVGEGFALNRENSQGKLVHLTVLNDGESLKGKISLGGESFKIQGTIADNEIKFTISPPNDEKSVKGNFKGKIEKFDELLLLTGDLNFDGKTWELSAFSKRQSIFKPVVISESSTNQATETVSKDEVMSVTETKEAETTETGTEPKEFYITPKEEKRILFGFIPNKYWGEKVLEVEVTDKEGKTATITVKENSETQIGDYKVGVGLFEGENYKLSVSKV